jgi:hypothetical protein
MALHIHPAPTEDYALGLEPEALFDRGIASQLDFSPCTQHSLPGESESTSQNTHDLPCRPGMAGGACDGAVGGNLAPRDFADGCDDAGLHGRGSHNAIHPARINHNEATETSNQRAIPCNSGR